jgi:hypothetical protein
VDQLQLVDLMRGFLWFAIVPVLLLQLPQAHTDCVGAREELSECLEKATCDVRTAKDYGCVVTCPKDDDDDCQELTDDAYLICDGSEDWEEHVRGIVKLEAEQFGCSASYSVFPAACAFIISSWIMYAGLCDL